MDARTRLGWIRLYGEVGNAGLVCRRCGISRPTLRKWWRRYQAAGEPGLEARSHRPHRPPNRKVFAEQEAPILRLRRERKLGIEMLRNELARRHGLGLALDAIHEVLVRHGEDRLERPRLKREGTRRCSRPAPGDRVQMDTCKIGPGLYQHAAVDGRSRWQVLGLYPRRTAASTLDVLERVRAGMPFPVQRVQTDRGQECVLRPRGPGPAPGSPDQVQARPAPRAAPERQGRARAAHRAGGVLADGRPEGPGPRDAARRPADLLQPPPPARRPRRRDAGRAHRRAGHQDPSS